MRGRRSRSRFFTCSADKNAERHVFCRQIPTDAVRFVTRKTDTVSTALFRKSRIQRYYRYIQSSRRQNALCPQGVRHGFHSQYTHFSSPFLFCSAFSICEKSNTDSEKEHGTVSVFFYSLLYHLPTLHFSTDWAMFFMAPASYPFTFVEKTSKVTAEYSGTSGRS